MKNKSKKEFFQELKTLFVLVVAAFTIKATLVEIYIVPTGSMEDTILTGDMLIGNKFIYGMRTPMWVGIPYTRIGFKTPHYRLPKFTEIKNGDVTIFEFPRDPFQKYVKRCIGIAGDTIHTVDRELYVNGKFVEFPIDVTINQNKSPKDQIQSIAYHILWECGWSTDRAPYMNWKQISRKTFTVIVHFSSD